jgi:uridylate kinase
MGKKGFGIDHSVLDFFSSEIKKVHKAGVEVGLVIG